MNSSLRHVFFVTLALLLAISSCKKGPSEIPINNFIHFPIGQKSINDSSLIVEADSLIKEYDFYSDEYGGRWLKVAFNKLNKNSEVSIRFLKHAGPLVLLPQKDPVPDMWIKPSQYIDSDHPDIIQQANLLTNTIEGTLNRARGIQLFVADDIEYKVFKDCGLVPASETLHNHYGTCINYSRLFVALCRAAGIPARSVWGCIYDGYGFKSHHNWAEFLDDDGKWHALDFSFTTAFDLNDIRYLDLLYSPEENIHYEDYNSFSIFSNGDYFFYDGSQSAVDGKLNVNIIVDNHPDEFELSMNYKISKIFD